MFSPGPVNLMRVVRKVSRRCGRHTSAVTSVTSCPVKRAALRSARYRLTDERGGEVSRHPNLLLERVDNSVQTISPMTSHRANSWAGSGSKGTLQSHGRRYVDGHGYISFGIYAR